MLEKVSKFKSFLGPDVWTYFLIAPVVGLLFFAIEYSFIFILQGFLSALGLLSAQNNFLPSWYPTSLSASIFLLFLFGVARALITMWKNYSSSLLQLAFTFRQRSNILTYGLKNSHLVSTKEIVSLFSDTIAQSGAVVQSSSVLINTAISALFFFIFGLKIAPIEMLIGITSLCLCLLPIKYANKKITTYGKGLVDEWTNSNESLLRGLRNHFFLTVYNQVDKEIRNGTKSLEKSKKHFIDYSLLSGYLNAFPMFLGMAILCIITYVSVRYIHTDAMQLISFFYIFLRLAQAASEASSSLTRLQLCMPGMRILYDWNLQCEKALARPKLEKKIIEQEDISIEGTNISFEFIKNKPLFTNLNFKLKSSEVFIIKGESGAGKSTLLSLILGFQPPSKGSIKINSFSTTEYTLDLHRVLAYVGPEPYIIQGTLKENLLYGLEESEEIPESSLWDALEKMELKTLVEKLPLKLNEPVHDIPQLSTGQKQRLSFARALLRKPSLLILDEATANLDSATEKRIINNLKDLFKNCTSIIVTHKGSFDDLGTYSLELDNSNSSTHI